MRFFVSTLLSLAVLGAAAHASADTASEASDHHRAGVAYAKSGKWDQAVRELEEAYRIDPTPIRLYDVAQVCLQAKQYVKARDAYAKVQDSPALSTEQQQRARAGIAAAKASIGHVRIAVADPKPGDSVTVDGAKARDSVVDVDPGKHTVKLTRDGEAAGEVIVEVAPGAETTASLAASAPSKPVEAARANVTEEPTGGGGGGIPAIAWVFGGVAIAALGTGAYFEIVGYQEYKEVRDSGCAPRCQDREESGKSKALVGDILIGVGIVSAIAAGYFFLTAPSDKPPAKRASRVDVGLSPGGGGAFVGVRSSF